LDGWVYLSPPVSLRVCMLGRPPCMGKCTPFCMSVCLCLYLSGVCVYIFVFVRLYSSVTFHMSGALWVYLVVCLFQCPTKCLLWSLCVCPTIYLSVCLHIYLSACLIFCLSVCPSIYLSVYLSVCLPTGIFAYLTACLSICMSVCLFVCLFVCQFVWLSSRIRVDMGDRLVCHLVTDVISELRPEVEFRCGLARGGFGGQRMGSDDRKNRCSEAVLVLEC